VRQKVLLSYAECVHSKDPEAAAQLRLALHSSPNFMENLAACLRSRLLRSVNASARRKIRLCRN